MSFDYAITVSQLNFYIKSIFDGNDNLRKILLKGEISNYCDHYKTGHIYFSLKDDNSLVKAVMFARQARQLNFKPDNGMKVILSGRVSIYEATGQYQVYVDSMQPDGEGELSLQYERLKKKLYEAGLFDESRKKPLPKYPLKIGIITSTSGAAVHDIKNILKRRYPIAELVICPTLVQGYEAPADIIRSIQKLNEIDGVDVIILGRGGGSIEDLWAFNEETVAYAISRSRIPIISAVGHETDYTISDFVADKRASTPSAAAEIVAPELDSISRNIDMNLKAIKTNINNMYSIKKSYLPLLIDKIIKNSNYVFKEKEAKLKEVNKKIYLDTERRINDIQNKLKFSLDKIEIMNPIRVMSKGYSMTFKGKEILKGTENVKIGDEIKTKFNDGIIISEVRKVMNGKED